MQPTVVDITQLLLGIAALIFNVLLAVGGVLVQKYVKDKRMATLLENALQNGLGKMQQATEAEIQSAAIKIPGVPERFAPAVQYVLDHADEARIHFGLTDQAIADKLLARLGVKNIQTNIAIAGSASPLVPEPVAPVPTNVEPVRPSLRSGV